MASAQSAIDHAHANRETYMETYKELLRIPSISTDPTYKAEVERCAQWVMAEMKRIGFNNCQVIPTTGHPVVYGDWLQAGDDKPTVLIYAHYDVQPVDPLNLWVSPPFEPTLRDGKLYARGAVDDKSGVFLNLKALESIFAVDGKLPINVKLFFEGEEESGSPNMAPFVAANTELLKSDLLILCDGGFDKQMPTIGYGGRGIVAAEVHITGPDHDLHSGMYGGVVQNPLHVVGKIVGSFHDDEGNVAIPGYYDAVLPVDSAELEALTKTWDVIGEKYKADSGAKHFWGETIAPFQVRVTSLPTLEVNGIWGGYSGPGTKTVIPSKAGFKATMRLVNNQNPAEIAELFKNYVLSFASDTAQVEVNILTYGWPFRGLFDGAAIEALQQALESTIGKRALLERSGGSIPIGGMFQRELGVPLTNFGLGSGDNIHSPNEYMNAEDFDRAMEAMIRVYYNLTDLMG